MRPVRARVTAPFPVALILIEFKIRIEERFMTAEFPDEYPRYRQRVPRLVPGLRLGGLGGLGGVEDA
jgi:protein-S-isoprenylcysteine O-methyltransferase Ste14